MKKSGFERKERRSPRGSSSQLIRNDVFSFKIFQTLKGVTDINMSTPKERAHPLPRWPLQEVLPRLGILQLPWHPVGGVGKV